MPLLSLLALLGCPADTPETDVPMEPSLGVDPAIPAQAGEARAGVVREGLEGEAALFGGVNAEGGAGDVKLYNSRVQFVIQAAEIGNGVVDAGGGIIDADVVRTDGTLGRDTVEDIFLAFGVSRLFHADRLEVVSDGSDGGDAVVVATGTDVPWSYLQGALELDEPLVGDLGLRITQTYRLAPDSDTLLITTELVNESDGIASFVMGDGLFLSGEDVLPWAPGVGFEGPSTGPIEAVAYAGRAGEATLGMWPAEGAYNISALASLTGDLGILLADHPPMTLGAGEALTVERTLMLAGDTATTEAIRRRSRGQASGAVVGTVQDADGPVAGARVHLVDENDAVAGFAMTAADGTWQAEVPPGAWTAYVVAHADIEHVELPTGAGRFGPYAAVSVNEAQLDVLRGAETAPAIPFAAGRQSPAGQSVQVTEGNAATVDFVLDAPSSLEVSVTDAGGGPLPAVVEVSWENDAPASAIPEGLHGALEVAPGRGRAAWAWTTSGTVEIPVLPGSYDISVNHSWRYGRAATSTVVGAGERATATVVLDEVVPRDGWLSLDPHLHGAPSFDGALPMEDRLITCAATGVDLPVTTDHDAIGDYRPLAEALGLNPRMAVVPGLEVTTILRGHFNLFPIQPAPLALLNGGAEAWWFPPEDTEDLFDRMRESAGPDALVQVNHPRAPGMFGSARYEAETGTIVDPDFWSWDFDTFELLNGGADDVDRIRADWFSFLNMGQIRTPTGASDSHYRFIPCGLARTDVFLDADSPAGVDPMEVRAALLAGHVVAARGTTLRAQMTSGQQDVLPGDTVTAGTFRLDAQILSPDWIQPGTLRVYRNGVVIEEQALTAAVGGVWFDDGWDLETSSDAWYVVEVAGTEPLSAAWRGVTPYAITNAFFVDVAGDGWEPPDSQ